MRKQFTFICIIMFFLNSCKKACNEPPNNNIIEEKNLSWLPDSAFNFYMISDKGIEMQFCIDTFYNKPAKQPTKDQNPINCPVLNTENIGRTYKSTYMDELHYYISSGFGDDYFKGNSLSITGGYFLFNISLDNPEGVNDIESAPRHVKSDYTYISQITVRNKKYNDVMKIWSVDLGASNPQYVDTIYTAKHHGLIYFTQKNGSYWARK
ncbi:MAG: hypothetical protein EOP53_11525 [Sphingobacteriales bacterium]|nr:MAG: hypothetical protein EOP53_11525 [Sphingobacteriales bacterium]